MDARTRIETLPDGERLRAAALSNLIDILISEIDLLRQLHAVLVEQQHALVEGDVGRIKHNVEKQLSILGCISGLEDERVSALKSLDAACGKTESMKLTLLIKQAPADEGRRLDEIRSSLREVLAGIGKVNRHNGMLINQSLSYIDRTLRMIAGEDPSSKVYTPEGEVKCSTGRIAVDREI